MKIRPTASVLLLFVVCFSVTSCDPSKAALKIFTDQGLTVLKPARDYIALGGFFVVPSNGGPAAYQDPWDTINGSSGNPSSFTAIIQQQGNTSSAGLKTVVGTLGGLVSIPAGLSFSDSAQVSLGQINATGSRYTSQQILALIKMPSTQSAITQLLNDGNGNKVYIVQEIYKASSLSLTNSSNNSLAAAVFGSPTPPNCTTTGTSTGSGASGNGTSDPSSTSSSTSSSASGASSSSTTSPSGAGGDSGTAGSGGHLPASSGGATNKAGTGSATGSTGGKGTDASGTGSNGTSSGSSNVGISVGVCWANSYTLSFKADSALPFAVRLNEIQLGDDGLLKVVITNFSPPNALGGDLKAVVALPPLENVVKSSHTH